MERGCAPTCVVSLVVATDVQCCDIIVAMPHAVVFLHESLFTSIRGFLANILGVRNFKCFVPFFSVAWVTLIENQRTFNTQVLQFARKADLKGLPSGVAKIFSDNCDRVSVMGPPAYYFPPLFRQIGPHPRQFNLLYLHTLNPFRSWNLESKT